MPYVEVGPMSQKGKKAAYSVLRTFDARFVDKKSRMSGKVLPITQPLDVQFLCHRKGDFLKKEKKNKKRRKEIASRQL